jgi:hypothetical protein
MYEFGMTSYLLKSTNMMTTILRVCLVELKEMEHYTDEKIYSYYFVVLVRKRTIPIERSPSVSEASVNFSG